MTRTRFGLVPLVLLLLASCRSAPPRVVPDTDSTAVMLDRIAAAIGPEVPFMGEPRVVDRLWPLRHDRSRRTFDGRLRLAQALVRVGRSGDAVELYDELLEEARERGLEDRKRIERLEFPRAVAYLRLGEEENCVANHTVESCLFPIRGGGIHRERRGSEMAMEAFQAILERRPDDLVSKWLLNVAAMTLGRAPETLPARWRIDPETYRPKSDFPAFKDLAPSLGLAVNGLSGGVVVDDFDGDGYLDILASAVFPLDSPEGQLRLFRNRRDGSFEDVTEEACLSGIRGGLNIVHADFDNNGYPDVLVLRGAWQMNHGDWPSTLLANQGGRFTDVTARAGILAFEPTQAADWGDFDGDGHLDLFIGTETGFPAYRHGLPARLTLRALLALRRLGKRQVQGHLYRNRGDGTFEDLFPRLGLDIHGWVKAVAWSDFDRDGRLDLYVARYGDRNLLLRNEGPAADGRWRFRDVATKAGVTEPILSFPTWFFDYDNDGWDDIFVGGYPYAEADLAKKGLPMELRMSSRDDIAELLGGQVASSDGKPRLYRNRGDGTFADVTREAGLWRAMAVMGANFGDLDNDGFLDLYLGTGTPPFYFLVPNRAFRNRGGKAFEDVTFEARLGTLAKGHGVGFGDLDNDGDQDIYTVLGGAFPGDSFPNALFENPGQRNDWITLRLEGTRANRSAIGARIEVTLTGRSGTRRIFRTVGSGGSFGASCLRAEIGLGRLAEEGGAVSEVTITWPDREGSVQRLGPLAANAFWAVRQGEPARQLELERLRLHDAPAGHVH